MSSLLNRKLNKTPASLGQAHVLWRHHNGVVLVGRTHRSCVGTEPIAVGLVGLEHLLTEFLVATALDGVQLETVRVGVHVMVLGEEVRNGVERGDNTEHHEDDDLLIWLLVLAEVGDVLSDVVGHLGGRRGGAVIVLDHTVVELGRHSDNHVIVVGVKVATLRDIKTEGRGVMVASEQIVGVVDQTRLMGTGLG